MYFSVALMIAFLFFGYLAYESQKIGDKKVLLINIASLAALLLALILEWQNYSSREEIIAIGLALIAALVANYHAMIGGGNRPSAFYWTALKQMPDSPRLDMMDTELYLDNQTVLLLIDRLKIKKQKEEALTAWKNTLSSLHQLSFYKAITHLQALHELLPEAVVKNNLGALYIETGEHEKGLEYLIVAEKMMKDWRIYFNLAVGLMKTDKFYESELYFAKIKSMEQRHWKVAFVHGKSMRKQGKLEEAWKLFTLATRLNPGHERVWYFLAIVQNKIGQPEKALASFDRAICLNAFDASLWYNRGNVLLKMGDYQQAIRSYDKAIERNPGYCAAFNNKGIALTRLGRTEEAITCYKKALSFDSSFYESLLNCALAYDSLQQPALAADYYERFLQCAPAHLQEVIQIVQTRLQAIAQEQQFSWAAERELAA